MRKLRLLREEAGAELLEFAMVSILFFTFVFGTMEFGRMIWQYNIIASVAKDGVRWAAVRGSTATTPADQSSLQTYVQGRAYGLSPTVTLNYPDGDNKSGSTVEVIVQGTFTPIVPILPQSARTLRSKARMLIAR